MINKGLVITLLIAVFGLIGFVVWQNHQTVNKDNFSEQSAVLPTEYHGDGGVIPFSTNSGLFSGLTSYSTFGDFAYLKSNVIWIVGNGNPPKAVTILPNDPGGFDYIYPSLSTDGKKIAYFANNQFISKSPNVLRQNPALQLWTINADGTDNRMIADFTGKYEILPYQLFPLIPVSWSVDNQILYALVVPPKDHGLTSQGMVAIDVKTGVVTKTALPNVVGINHVSFSPDRSKVAYVLASPGESYTDWKPPYAIGTTDLHTGISKTLIESQTDFYSNVLWSLEGNTLLYSVSSGLNAGIFSLDLSTNISNLLLAQTNKTAPVYPLAWLSQGIIGYALDDYSSGPQSQALYTMKIDGTGNKFIAANGDGNILTLLKIILP